MKVAVSKDRAAFFISFYQIIQVYNRLKRYRVYIETAGDESAVVDNTGKVSVLSYNEETAGKVTITASVDGVNYSCEIEVKKPEMNKKSVVVKQGKSQKLAVKNTKLKKIEWTSSDEGIAVVDSKGKITGMSSGVAVIGAKVGGVTTYCEVNVK